MRKAIFLFSLLLIGIGLESDPINNDYLPYNDAFLELQRENPSVDTECIEVAANIMVGNYEAIEDKMATKHGRCATRVLGLIVRLDVNGNIK